MFRYFILFAFGFLLIGCTSDDPLEENDQMEIEPPKLIVNMEQDSIAQTWRFIFEKGDRKDTLFTGKKTNYQFVDTANVDGIGLPEYIVLRDSLIAQGSGIDQRGFWSYHRTCSVLDVWSLDRKELLFSLIKREVHSSRHSDDFIPLKKIDDQKERINLNHLDFYEYDVEFKFGKIVIKHLRKSKNINLEPDFVEGTYHFKDGALQLIEN